MAEILPSVSSPLKYLSQGYKTFSALLSKKEFEMVSNLRFFSKRNFMLCFGSMISIPEQLGWESLHKRRKGSKLILVFKGLKGILYIWS